MFKTMAFITFSALINPFATGLEVAIGSTTRICFGRLHPECFLLEERVADGKSEFILALTKRGRVSNERTLTSTEHARLLRAILHVQSKAKPENELCPFPFKVESFKGEDLIDVQTFCASRPLSEGLRSTIRNAMY